MYSTFGSLKLLKADVGQILSHVSTWAQEWWAGSHASVFTVSIIQLNTIKKRIVKHILNLGSGELSSIQQLSVCLLCPPTVCYSSCGQKAAWFGSVCVFTMTTSQGSLVAHTTVLVNILCSRAGSAHRGSSVDVGWTYLLKIPDKVCSRLIIFCCSEHHCL